MTNARKFSSSFPHTLLHGRPCCSVVPASDNTGVKCSDICFVLGKSLGTRSCNLLSEQLRSHRQRSLTPGVRLPSDHRLTHRCADTAGHEIATLTKRRCPDSVSTPVCWEFVLCHVRACQSHCSWWWCTSCEFFGVPHSHCVELNLHMRERF